MKKNRLIPFSWLPASWGLAGPAREEAEAYYYYEGYDLEERLIEIKVEDPIEQKKAILDAKRRHHMISDKEHTLAKAELVEDETEREISVLQAQAEVGEIDSFQAEKEIATLRGEPWVRIVNDGVDLAAGIDGYFFEFDWNEIWINVLKENGYVGRTEESIIQAWFQDVCRNEASASMGAPPINGGIIVG